MIEKLTNLLKEIGFNDKEIDVYSALLPLGSASIRTISDRVKINRGTVYDVLESLVKKGFIDVKKSGSKRKFIVKSPEELLVFIENQRKSLENTKMKIKEALPFLLSSYMKGGGKPTVEYFDDDKGIKHILEDVLNTFNLAVRPPSLKKEYKEYYVYSSKSVRNYLYKLFPNFTKEKLRLGIKTKVIALGEGADPKNLKLAQRKYIHIDAPAYMLIYRSKIALISVADDKKPFGVIISNEKIAKTQKIIFESLFSKIN